MRATSSLIATYAAALLCTTKLAVAAPAPAHPRSTYQLDRRLSEPPFRNGDFESGKLKPWQRERLSGAEGIPLDRIQIVSPGYNSDHALQLKPEPQYDSVYVSQIFGEPPNTNYTVSLMYKVLESPDPSTCVLQMSLDDLWHTNYAAVASAPMVVGDWTPLTVAYPNWNPMSGMGEAEMRLVLRCPDGTVLFDDITITPTNTLEPTSCSGSPVVPDGDFESGDFASWTRPNDPYASLVSPGANGSAHALAMSFPANTQYAEDFIEQTVTGICFNYYYTLEFDVNWVDYGPVPSSTADSGCDLSMTASYCNRDDLTVFTWPTAPGWVHHSYDCVAGSNLIAPSFQISCNDKAPTNAWSVEIDNVAINYVGGPAPAPTLDPSSTPAPKASAGHKRAEQIAKPRWA